MKPVALRTATLSTALSPAQIEERFRALGPIARRFGRFPKGTVLPETQIVASPKVAMADFPVGFIPKALYERNLEQNQLIAGCCRHPENHEIEARKSHPDEQVADIYHFHCTSCGKVHRVFCVGAGDVRPEWDGDDPQWREKAGIPQREAQIRADIAAFHERVKSP